MSAEPYRPIDTDVEFGRHYIPLPGGWEVQTRGSGSTFRIADTKTGDRLAIPESPYLHETLERMAREVNAAWNARPSFDMDTAVEAAYKAHWSTGESCDRAAIREALTAVLPLLVGSKAGDDMHDESLRKGFERYEYVRTLAPIHFIALWEKSIRGEGRFDDLVDAALQEQRRQLRTIRAEKEAGK